ncbi:MAG: NfeD family protein [Planctomycetaceae bacterium]
MVLLCVVWGLLGDDVRADDIAAVPAVARRHVESIPLGEDLDPSTQGRIRNAMLGLARRAADGEAVAVLEITPGSADHQSIVELAEFLVSAEVRDVRTVAWVPESLLGPRALLPLVCREIVMHPDAELGDLRYGAPWPAPLRQRVERVVSRRTNPLVSPAMIRAMFDPDQTLLRLETDAAEGTSAVRVIAADELPLLKQAGVAFRDVRTLKPAGLPAVFSGAQAEAEGILVTGVARSLDELAKDNNWEAAELEASSPHHQVERPVLIKVEGQIDPLLSSYLHRQIDRAVERNADTIIFEIDSPGGLLQDSLDLAFKIADLREQQIRTVAYVPHDAVSGAALISLGCDEIYLHPTGKIGDAGPILQSMDGNVHRAPEKIVSYLREVVRELAEKKGRPPAVLMAMVDRELDVYSATNLNTGRTTYLSAAEMDAEPGVWKRGPRVAEAAGELLLFVNGRQAHELQVAEPPVENMRELRTRLGIAPEVKLIAAEQTWMDDMVFILNTNFVSGLLLFLGVILLFVELHFMLGLAGILSALCFGVFFWSKFLGGTAGWLEVLLFLLGFACLVIEIFVIPGFGVFGVAGGMLILGSLVMAGATISDVDSGSAMTQSLETVKTLGLAILCVIVAAMGLSHFLPKIPLLNAMVLSPPPSSGSGFASSYSPRSDPQGLRGQRGIAVTMLRPSGKVRVNGQLLDAVAANGFVSEGVDIEIADVASNRVIVQPVEG